MKRIFMILLLSVLLSTSACKAAPVNSSAPAKTKEMSSEGRETTNMDYIVELTTPDTVNKKTDFTLEAKFTNMTNSSIRIFHGQRLFTFYISKKNGDVINYYPIKSIGVGAEIPKNGSIMEQYTYNIDSPGEYEVWAVANFDISENNIDKKYELSTKKQVLVVR